MRIQFWGTRGSIARPGPATARYGGNTSCVEVRSDRGTLIVIDCGTGAYALGEHLLAQGSAPLHGHILISHTHWDHIQGIPFFAPLHAPGNEWDIYGPKGLSQSLAETLAGQMEHTYFPISLEQLGATIRYHDLVEGTFTIDDIRVTTRYLNHPALTLGYRIEADGASMVYCCDHEPHSPALASGEGDITGYDRRYVDFVSRADLVIHDAQYTALEYPAKAGWGHSSSEYAVRVGQDAGVRKLVLTHHDPSRDDEALDAIVEAMQRRARDAGSALEVIGAAEGQTIELRGNATRAAQPGEAQFLAHTAIDSGVVNQPVLVYVPDQRMKALLDEALALEGLPDRFVADDADLLHALQDAQPPLALVQHAPPRIDGVAIARAVRASGREAPVKVPVVIVTDIAPPPDLNGEDVTDWLQRPFSLSYARTRIRAWVLHSACRWIRAQLPPDETQRLGALRGLAILDTEPEARFDRLTRIAAETFDVPIALVSLVDSERQWFKSCLGLNVRETSRDAAFCAHVVLARRDLVVSDTLHDARFADNPLVHGEPRVRFYAGAPLILDDGSCIGTFCLIDTRPRELDPTEIGVLHDLRDLALEEIRRQPTP